MRVPTPHREPTARRILRYAFGVALLVAVVGTAQSSTAADASGAAEKKESSTPASGAQWKSLFDGNSLTGWKITDFAGHAGVHVEKDFKGSPAIVFESGVALTGINWTNDVPKINYEIELDAMNVQGSDFFCGLTFPYKDSHCSFIVGGWGGAVVGISSVDNMDASENDTTKYLSVEKGRWYHIRVKVTDTKIETWIDKDKMVDLDTTGKKIGLRFGEIDLSVPLGLAAYQTQAAMRNFRIRKL
jgi:hypothetical protein